MDHVIRIYIGEVVADVVTVGSKELQLRECKRASQTRQHATQLRDDRCHIRAAVAVRVEDCGCVGCLQDVAYLVR